MVTQGTRHTALGGMTREAEKVIGAKRCTVCTYIYIHIHNVCAYVRMSGVSTIRVQIE